MTKEISLDSKRKVSVGELEEEILRAGDTLLGKKSVLIVVLAGLSGSGKTRLYNLLNEKIDHWHEGLKPPSLYTRSLSLDSFSHEVDGKWSLREEDILAFLNKGYRKDGSMLIIIEGNSQLATDAFWVISKRFDSAPTPSSKWLHLWAILVPDPTVLVEASKLKLKESTGSKTLNAHWAAYWERIGKMTPGAAATFIRKETDFAVRKAPTDSSSVRVVGIPKEGTVLKGWEDPL